ncbi:hypothetical protein K474DRAFT_1635557 [Panus rudis PR-1116 ss-1]|nr:hypothetical protein K474DRAFT_1635557 [Panus rudis PR-1116 ss-1]
MGPTGSGKSTFANLASGTDLFPVSNSLKSCTETVERTTPFEVDGVSVTLIDTPGFDDSNLSDTEIFSRIAAYLSTSYEQGFKLSGIIYTHRICDYKMGGIAMKNFSVFRKLCGDTSLKNVVIVTNMWSDPPRQIELDREAELKTDEGLFKPALDKGAQMKRHYNSVESAHDIIRGIVARNRPSVLQIQRELVTEKKGIENTEACEELDKNLAEVRKKHRLQLEQYERELKEALAAKDHATQEEMQKLRSEVSRKLTEMDEKRKDMARAYEEEKKKSNAKINELLSVLHTQRLAAEEQQKRFEQLEFERKKEQQILLQRIEQMQYVNDAILQQLRGSPQPPSGQHDSIYGNVRQKGESTFPENDFQSLDLKSGHLL